MLLALFGVGGTVTEGEPLPVQSVMVQQTSAPQEEIVEEIVLPQDVTALIERGYPGYTVAAIAGGGSEDAGLFALALAEEESRESVLVLAEKAEGDATYALTIENPHALPGRSWIPDMRFDTDGNTLRCSYYGEWSESTDIFSREDGAWRLSGTIVYESRYTPKGRVEVYTSSVSGGELRYTWALEDDDGNVLDAHIYPPIPVSEGYEQGMLLANYDDRLFTAEPDWGVTVADGIAEGLYDEGDTLLDLDVLVEDLALLVEKPDGTRRLRVAHWDGTRFTVRETGDLPGEASLDMYHASDRSIIVQCWPDEEGRAVSLIRSGETWSVSRIFVDDEIFNMGCEEVRMIFGGMMDYLTAIDLDGRNDGIVYGDHPWSDVFAIDFSALPKTFEEAAAQVDTSGWAVVNNPNPEDRLHLRKSPDRGADSLGKFYNRTPLRVLERGKTWTRVRIGNDEHGLEGWMMTQYLAFGEEIAKVECAFPVVPLRDELENGDEFDNVDMLQEPKDDAQSVGIYMGNDDEDFIIGVVEKEWYVLMLRDGTVGYGRRDFFREENN